MCPFAISISCTWYNTIIVFDDISNMTMMVHVIQRLMINEMMQCLEYIAILQSHTLQVVAYIITPFSIYY